MKKWNTLTALSGFALIAFLITSFLFNQSFTILTPKKLQHYWEITSPYLITLIGLMVGVILLSFAWNKFEDRIRASRLFGFLSSNRTALALLCWVFTLGMWLFLLNLNTDLFLKILVFFGVFFLTLCVSYLAFRLQYPSVTPAIFFLAAILASGFLLVAGIFGDKVSAYPYSFDWSEGNRFFNAALIVDWLKSGFKTPLPVLHPTRYFLKSLAFLFSTNSILFHRLWQALLWIGMPLLCSYAIFKRIHLANRLIIVLLSLFGFLFLHQGPIYYHLLAGVIPVLLWFRFEKKTSATILILLCSIWAGLSRINWYFMPLTIAVLITLFENPSDSPLQWKTLKWFVVWGVVSLAAVGATKYLYQHYSGNPSVYFDSALSSDLLWYRLLPNSTFPPGILIGILITLVPVVYWVVRMKANLIQNILSRWLILAILGVYFAGSLIVSVKIGGGSNLHNLDSFLLLVLIVAAFALKEQLQQLDLTRVGKLLAPGLVTLLIPLSIIAFTNANFMIIKNMDHSATIQELQKYLDAMPGGSKVMSITNCQLFSFGNLRADEVQGKYEKIMLMEMAMGNNATYLDEFRQDLRSHKYPLIFSERLLIQTETSQKKFGEENNIWVDQISNSLLEYYQPYQYYKNIDILMLIPK